MDQVGDGSAAPVIDRLLERIENEIGRQRARDAPAHDAAGEDIDDERHNRRSRASSPRK